MLKSVKVSLKLPFGSGIEGTWEPDAAERKAAWEMYVELVTRVAVVELGPDEGLLREALSSLYSLFDTTRDILRRYGPSVATPSGKGELSFGYLALAILNQALRPILAKWHPLLLDYESTRPAGISAAEHEHRWARGEELRSALTILRRTMEQYADTLARVAGVPPLIGQRTNTVGGQDE